MVRAGFHQTNAMVAVTPASAFLCSEMLLRFHVSLQCPVMQGLNCEWPDLRSWLLCDLEAAQDVSTMALGADSNRSMASHDCNPEVC